MQAIRVHQSGGPEALSVDTVDVPRPGHGEALVRHTAIGVNFIDIYQREGLYPLPLPFTAGNEGAGVVEAVGPGVTEVTVGDRVAYCMAIGAYAEWRTIASHRLVRVPDGVPDDVAAAAMLKGLTAEYLVRRTRKLGPGDTILFHAVAGATGLIAVQWAVSLGATVIGTAGSEAKAALARDHGCSHVINYRNEDFVARTKELTGGRGVDVVYDSVGKDTFPGSLDVLRPRGMFVSFGQSSGLVPEFAPRVLSQKGSLFMTRPNLANYISDRAELEEAAAALFAMIASGSVRVRIDRRLPLAGAADAHRALEARQTSGSIVLLP
ncbi:MAG: quinone oxidoreductase [Bauldia sp.]|nr:quinone oxidoreductase [Bauldia sp.]